MKYLDERFIVMTYPVRLPAKSPYSDKDQAKANICNKFIGYGVTGSSTEAYRLAYGKEANTSQYHKDIVFVSVNGGGKNVPLELYKEQLILAKENGCTIIMDNEYHRNRSYNTGERIIHEMIKEIGFFQIKDTYHYAVFK